MRGWFTVSRALVALAMALCLSACGGQDATSPGPMPARLEIAGGDAQSDTVRRELARSLVVRALDASGSPMAGVNISFLVTEGDGQVISDSPTTGREGEVSARWILGPLAGDQKTEARAGGGSEAGTPSVVFTAVGFPDRVIRVDVRPDSLTLARGDTVYMGEEVQFEAAAYDQFGNLRTDRDFFWGLLTPGNATIDEAGILTTADTGRATVTARTEQVQSSYAVELVRNPGNPASLDFQSSGGGDFVEVPFHVSLDVATNWTLEAWIKPERVLTSDKSFVISRWGTTGKAAFGLYLYEQRLVLAVHDGVSTQTVESGDVIEEHAWQHVAATFDQGTVTLYVNGAADTVATGVLTPLHSLLPLNLGRETQIGIDTIVNGFYGAIDEVRIWNVTRSASAIAANVNRGLTGTEVGLVAYWMFDEGAGDTVYDLTGNSNHGRLGTSVGEDRFDPVWKVDVPLIIRP